MKKKLLLVTMLFISVVSISACDKKSDIELFDEALHEAYPNGLDYEENWYSIRLEEQTFGINKIYNRVLEGAIYADFKDNFYGTFLEAEYKETYTILERDEDGILSNIKYENEFKCKGSNLYMKKTTTDLLTNEVKTTTLGSSNVKNRKIEDILPSSFFDYSGYLPYNTCDNKEACVFVDDNLHSFNKLVPIYFEKMQIGVKNYNLIFNINFIPIVLSVKENRDYYVLGLDNHDIETKYLELNIIKDKQSIEVPTDYSSEYELAEDSTFVFKF